MRSRRPISAGGRLSGRGPLHGARTGLPGRGGPGHAAPNRGASVTCVIERAFQQTPGVENVGFDDITNAWIPPPESIDDLAVLLEVRLVKFVQFAAS
jgi:hypothetical protein